MTDEMLEAIADYSRRGWKIQPIPPGELHPNRPDWQHRASSDPETVSTMFAERQDWQGISIATGRGSGIFVIDVDVAEGKQGDESLADLEAEHGALPETYEVITGRGGRHLYFRWDETHPVFNDQAKRLGPGLDVRGEGGQVIAPPAMSPKPGGGRYEVDLGTPDEPAEAPLWLLELLTRTPVLEPRRERPQRAQGDAPGDIYAQRHAWPEILEADGATLVGVRRDRQTGQGYELWARPGIEDHHGATLYYGGADALKVFTSAWPGLDEGATYTRFGYYAATRHGGDYKAAAHQLRQEGYVPEMPEDEFQATHFTRRAEPISSSDEMQEEWTYTDDPATWPEIVPFPERETEPWPIEVLPDWMREHCEAVALKLQVPVDLCAQLALGVLSSMCMGHIKVQVDRGWEEHVNLYLVTAMLSGTGKSPATKVMAAPVYALEKMLREEMVKEIQEKERAKAVAVQKVKQLEKSMAMGSVDPIDYLTAVGEAEAIIVPSRPKLLIDDATPEVLVKNMEQHKGRMSVISSEGEVFDMVRGTYAKAGKANINVYLKGWSAEPVRVDRKGQGAGTGTELEIEEAMLTLCVAVQPSVLEDIARDEVLSSRGFTARFMPSVPAEMLGKRDFSARRQAEVWGKDYDDRMVAIGRRMNSWEHPLVIRLGPEAVALFEDWQTQLELRMNTRGQLRQVSEWVSKITGSVIRVAGLLAAAEGHDREMVSYSLMQRAIRVGDYWIKQAMGLATGLWEGAGVDLERCQRVVRWVSKGAASRSVVAMRDLRRAMKWTPEELADVIGDLERHFCTILAPVESAGTVGRPKLPDLRFHPSIWRSEEGYGNLALLAENKDPQTTTTPSHPLSLGGNAKMPKLPEPEPEEPGDGWSLL